VTKQQLVIGLGVGAAVTAAGLWFIARKTNPFGAAVAEVLKLPAAAVATGAVRLRTK
jgi:hypothetical protein